MSETPVSIGTPLTKEQTIELNNRAACKDKGDKMFPKGYRDISYIADARRICMKCEVKELCAQYTFQWNPLELHGIWAGKSPRQNVAYAKKEGIIPTKDPLTAIWD